MARGVARQARLELRLVGTTLRAGMSIEGAEQVAEREIDLAAAEAIAADMGTIINRATRWGDVDQGSRELLRQRGELLFDSLLPPPTKATLRTMCRAKAGDFQGSHSEARANECGMRLLLVLDPGLLGLPWELMHSGIGFLGLELAVGRIVRGVQAESTLAVGPERSWRTLVVCDPRGDLIGSYYEGLTLRDELAQGDKRVEVDLRSSEVSLAEVRRLLREYDIVHFAGHAERGGGAERGWWLRDGVLGPTAIRELAGGRRFPRLIFSNACRSAGDGSVGGLDATGLAAAFLEAGVEHYIGTIQDVPDEPASLFALTFYATLRARPEAGVGEAMRAARVMLAERYGPASVYWASWVLYGAPASACMTTAPAIALETRATTRPGATREGYVFHEAGARVRGAAAAATAMPGGASADVRWAQVGRGAGMALGTVGLVWLLVMLASLLGRMPPVAWTSGRALARFEAPIVVSVAGDVPLSVRLGVPASARLERVREGTMTMGAVPRSERFRLRFAAPEAGVIAIWCVNSRGAIRRIDVPNGPLSPVQAGWVVEVPEAAGWKDGGEAAGEQWFYLAWRQVPPSDPRAFEDEFERELQSTSGEIQAGRQEPPQAIRRARLEEALEDRFDTVTRLAVEQR